ncbi:hypothetical protein PoB_001672900 [Plakobranchus ocellatus]|uniref:Uncharacterized protein n=1 Tax=Plakobranchus ocellatus TaxID=259542 RepID=A0AAV3Z4J5_9GAST|nr:hypothetical protein PoB_001672900 [Plakobranchus ocellatus]
MTTAEVPPAIHAVNRRPGSGVYLRKKGSNHQPGKVPAALQGVPDPGDTHQSRLIQTRLPSYPSLQAIHSHPSSCSRNAHQAAWLAQDTVVISACLKELFDTRCFRMDSLSHNVRLKLDRSCRRPPLDGVTLMVLLRMSLKTVSPARKKRYQEIRVETELPLLFRKGRKQLCSQLY